MTDPTSDVRFMACLPNTLIQECPLPSDWSNPKNFSNDAHDPGGATMCGITQSEYWVWLKQQGLPLVPVQKLTQSQGYAIYYNNYWLPYCPELAAGMDQNFFDTRVNEGSESIKILQFVLGIEVDGQWGPQTDAAVKAMDASPIKVIQDIKAFTARREAVYREFADYQYFGEDWERRSAEVGAESVAMAPTGTS
jgi:lysozyme family protein